MTATPYKVRFGLYGQHRAYFEHFDSALLCARTLRSWWQQHGAPLGLEVTLSNQALADESTDGLTDEERDRWDE